MTFYWWSHWFWITLMSNILFATIVHTYPSQEITTEYNENSKVTNAVTKLFQTSPTTLWPTTAPATSEQIMDLTENSGTSREIDESLEKEEADLEETDAIEIESDKNEIQKSQEDPTYMDENSDEYEFKRSAKIDSNKTQKFADLKINNDSKSILNDDTHDNSAIKANKKPTVTITEDDDSLNGSLIQPNIDKNSETSFSSNFSNLSTNLTNDNITTLATPTTTINSNSNSPPSAPAAPHIDSESAAAEWLHTAIVPPAISQPNIEDISSNLVTAASASQKVPFTLENVNKKDEIIRAESEQRSRKSKVLSAEYKHRYINYSSDPKSLLTRSASTAPNDFDGDSESNISSEALAIQRTYFLDAGAISAICFTVFGVCCTVGTIGIVLYRRRYLNKPQTLSEPDSSVYIDDSTMRVSDNSDEMYSLDNDSFLNSLEAMTIQNYWTDTVKHTKL